MYIYIHTWRGVENGEIVRGSDAMRNMWWLLFMCLFSNMDKGRQYKQWAWVAYEYYIYIHIIYIYVYTVCMCVLIIIIYSY